MLLDPILFDCITTCFTNDYFETFVINQIVIHSTVLKASLGNMHL
jgi:hypothetical protein